MKINLRKVQKIVRHADQSWFCLIDDNQNYFTFFSVLIYIFEQVTRIKLYLIEFLQCFYEK